MDVIERFLNYVRMDTQSSETTGITPSTAKQKKLAEKLAAEMKEIGIADARTDAYGYVYGKFPATPGKEKVPTLGLIAHMDTSPDAPGENVHPKIIDYTGGDVVLENGKKMEISAFPSLRKYQGQKLIVTDGNTLLGADDKAGIAEILAALDHLYHHPEIAHGEIAVAFTPDEEIGEGADHFDLKSLGAVTAYTLDGGELPVIEYENFNAASASLRINGVNIHPGSAKNKMKNAILMGQDFLNLLPKDEIPARTEGYEGFYHVRRFEGDETTARIDLLIRDHDREKFEARKNYLGRIAEALNGQWGEGSFELTVRDSYYNMKEKILPHMELIRNAEEAMRRCGLKAETEPIRGGTDGARLSFEGLPCPNLCTGGANYHGIFEFIPVEAMKKMTEVLVELIRLQG